MKQYINGRMIAGEGREICVRNPANGEVLRTFQGASPEQALEALEAARDSFVSWSELSIDERSRHIMRLADALEAHREQLIQTLILETGKPVGTAEYDYQMLIDCLRYYDEEIRRLHGEIITDGQNSHLNLISYKPIGVVVGYLAWNFPLLNVGYKLGPVLASGCTCVLKPASVTPLSTLLVGQIACEIGFPRGVINIVSGRSDICQAMNASTIPSMLTLIGSSQTGRDIVAQSATSIKRYSLELGGNAPVIVMDDAEIEKTARMVVRQKFDNCGQVCVCPNRIFVPEKHTEAFVKYAKAEAESLVLTCEAGVGIAVGPMSSAEAREHMEELVADAIQKGATLVCGGKRPEHPGFYYKPTILTDVTREMRVYQEEIFGPILPIVSYREDEDIVQLANDTEYGLAGYLFTNDLDRAMQIADRMRFGSVSVNEAFYAYNLPHGGVKESGIGKDCSHFSLNEYLEVRRVSIKRR